MPFTTSWLASRQNFLVKQRPASALLGLLGLLGLLSLAACETSGDLTVDLPGTEASSSKFLDIAVSASTIRLAPTLTLKSDRFLVGRLRDQTTGLTEAQAVLNLRASTSLDSLPGRLATAAPGLTAPTLESVTLLVPIEQVYGTATAPLRFDVLPLRQRLDDRQIYAADSRPDVAASAIATNLSARLNATRQVRQTTTDSTGAVVTTTVPDQLVSQVLQAAGSPVRPLFASVFEKLKSSTFVQADLDAVLPGIVLAPSAGYEGSIVGFGRGRAGAQLKFSFMYDSVQAAPLPAVRRRRSYSLFFGPGPNANMGDAGSGADPRYYSYLVNDRAGSPLAALSTTSSAVPAAALDGRSYLQDGIGLGTRIAFQDLGPLLELRNTPGVVLNRAELLVPVQPFTGGVFPTLLSFYLLEVDAANNVLVRPGSTTQVATERIVQRDGVNPQGSGAEAVARLTNAGSPNPSYSLLMTTYLQAYLLPKGLGPGELPAALVLTPTLRSIPVRNPDPNSRVEFTQAPPPLTLNRAVLDANNIKLRVYYSQLR